MSVGYNPKAVTDGLVLCLDAANPKSFSPNVHPNPTDIYGWVQGASNATLSRDTITSPVGNTPLKMVQSGNDPYTNSYNGESGRWKLAPAVAGQTWTVSVWVKASQAIQIEGCWVASLDSAGNYLAGGGSPNPTIGTTWTRISGTYTHTNASTAYVGIRLDGTPTGGSGVTVWWDGLQVELSSSVTTFNPKTNTNRSSWKDVSGQGTTGTLTNFPMYGNGAIVFDGVNNYVDFGNPASVNFGDGSFTIGVWCYRDTNVTTNLRILAKGAGGDTAAEAGFALFGSDSNIYLIVNPSSTTRPSTGAISITPGVPFYVTAIVERNVSMRIYKNGILSSTVAAPVGSFTGTSSLCIGCNTTSAGGRSVYWDGGVYHAHFYNRALSASEIENNFNAMRGRFGI